MEHLSQLIASYLDGMIRHERGEFPSHNKTDCLIRSRRVIRQLQAEGGDLNRGMQILAAKYPEQDGIVFLAGELMARIILR